MRLLPRFRRHEQMPEARRAERFLLAGAEQSRTLGHEYVGTEHVLLALTEDLSTAAARALAGLGLTGGAVRRDLEHIIGTCAAPERRAIDPDALATLGIDLDEVTRRIEETFGPGALQRIRSDAPEPLSRTCGRVAPRLKRALELAVTEAGDDPVRSEHMLVSLAAVEDCVAARILARYGATAKTLRDVLA